MKIYKQVQIKGDNAVFEKNVVQYIGYGYNVYTQQNQ